MDAKEYSLQDLLDFVKTSGPIRIGVSAASRLDYWVEDNEGKIIEFPKSIVDQARQRNAAPTNEKESKLKSRLRPDYTDDELERVRKEIEFHQSIRRIFSAVDLLSREETAALLSLALNQYEAP